jgi:hypothetical protein
MSYALRIEPESFATAAAVASSKETSLERLGAWTGTQRKRFARLIEAATEEITGRLADYFLLFAVEVPPIGAVARDAQRLAAFAGFSTTELETGLVRGLRVLEDLGVRVNLDSAASDEISMVLMQSILDAYAAVCGAIVLGSSGARDKGEAVREPYAIEKTRSGVTFACARGEGRALLIVSNTAVHRESWRRPCSHSRD